jgi:signal transduction histidine kinase
MGGDSGSVITDGGAAMHGTSAIAIRTGWNDTSDIGAGLGNDGRPPLNTALKPRGGTGNALDRKVSPRHSVTSRDAVGFALEPASAFRAHGVIHDIRNLLQVLLSGVWVAENRIREGRADEVPAVLGEIGMAVDRANTLLRQIVRTPEDGRCAVDIDKMLAGLSASLGWTLGASKELIISVASDLPPVYCLESELENSVLNLIINARDAMPNGGRATIEAAACTGSDAPGGVVLRVHDTGVGMDRGVAAKAFEPYFTTKGADAGIGLGLAMVATFAQSIGGSARIEHSSAKGTTIALYLPGASRSQAKPV